MRKVLFFIAGLLACASINAQTVSISRTSCNYQHGETALVDGKARVSWQLEGDALAGEPTAYQLVVTERITGRVVYDSGRKESAESQLIELPMLVPNDYGYKWRVRQWCGKCVSDWSREQTLRVVDDSANNRIPWIGAISKKDANIPVGRWSNSDFRKEDFRKAWADVDTLSSKSIILRKAFRAHRKVVDATVSVSGLGHYELSINGKKVGDSEFAPLWSEYTKTIYYNVYDVTRQLSKGDNDIEVLLGNGMFNVQRMGRYSKLQASFGAPQLWFRMRVCYDDGTCQEIVSDDSWTWRLSAITFNSIYGGESYDARLEKSGGATAEHKAVVVESPGGKLCVQTAPPVKIMEYYGGRLSSFNSAGCLQKMMTVDKDSLAAASAKTKREIDPSVFVCDMGQNLAGFPQITVSGHRGQKVTLLVSERLTPQGVCDQSQTGRQHFYEYTLKGEGMETWHPRFSYYGFRYIQVEGAVAEGCDNPNDLPVLHELKSCFVYNSAEETSLFWCSNDLFNQTHRLIERAERSNMQAVLSDCPHREKLGWLEQDHLNGPSLLYNYDMAAFIPKVIRDIADTQKPDGMVPTTAPQYVSFGNLFDDSPEWGSTLVILPFMYYDYYGDNTLITNYYENMCRYVDYLTSRAEDGIVSHGLGDWYDYGPWRAGFSKNTPVPLVATAHYIYDLQLMVKAAKMMGKAADATKYETLCRDVTSSFNRHFYKPDSCYYGTGSQASNALPLFLGIAGDNKAAVLNSLVNDIHAHGDRLTTGDVGNRYLFRVLADNGQNELLFKMLNHYETPGYGFQILQGATTLTEQWDPRQGSSWNHFMMGQIDEWFFRTIAGIRQKPGTHGMKHLIINPQLVGDINKVDVTVQTPYGKVRVKAEKTAGGKSVVDYTIPIGCHAEVGE